MLRAMVNVLQSESDVPYQEIFDVYTIISVISTTVYTQLTACHTGWVSADVRECESECRLSWV
jgi:hypothetical protein